jgi:hypothetical protein
MKLLVNELNESKESKDQIFPLKNQMFPLEELDFFGYRDRIYDTFAKYWDFDKLVTFLELSSRLSPLPRRQDCPRFVNVEDDNFTIIELF